MLRGQELRVGDTRLKTLTMTSHKKKIISLSLLSPTCKFLRKLSPF